MLSRSQTSQVIENLLVVFVARGVHKLRIALRFAGSFRPQIQDDRAIRGHGGGAYALSPIRRNLPRAMFDVFCTILR